MSQTQSKKRMREEAMKGSSNDDDDDDMVDEVQPLPKAKKKTKRAKTEKKEKKQESKTMVVEKKEENTFDEKRCKAMYMAIGSPDIATYALEQKEDNKSVDAVLSDSRLFVAYKTSIDIYSVQDGKKMGSWELDQKKLAKAALDPKLPKELIGIFDGYQKDFSIKPINIKKLAIDAEQNELYVASETHAPHSGGAMASTDYTMHVLDLKTGVEKRKWDVSLRWITQMLIQTDSVLMIRTADMRSSDHFRTYDGLTGKAMDYIGEIPFDNDIFFVKNFGATERVGELCVADKEHFFFSNNGRHRQGSVMKVKIGSGEDSVRPQFNLVDSWPSFDPLSITYLPKCGYLATCYTQRDHLNSGKQEIVLTIPSQKNRVMGSWDVKRLKMENESYHPAKLLSSETSGKLTKEDEHSKRDFIVVFQESTYFKAASFTVYSLNVAKWIH